MEEFAVIAELQRRGVGWPDKYRRLFATVMRLYPACIHSVKVKGRVARKVAIYLARHEDVWEKVFDLVGWTIIKQNVVSLWLLNRLLYGKLVEGLNWGTLVAFTPSLRFGSFVKRVEQMRREYMAIASGTSGGPFARRVGRSAIYAYAVRGKSREELRKRIRRALGELLSAGIVPIDYSYNYVIVAIKKVRRGCEEYWLSVFGYNPVEVLRGLYAPPVEIILTPERIRGLKFEERGIGWGLTAVES